MKNETKKERFIRVAEKRVQNVLKSIASLSGLANRNVYEWNETQLKKIWTAIEQEILKCRDNFDNPNYNSFKL
jgi:hypothetical protein